MDKSPRLISSPANILTLLPIIDYLLEAHITWLMGHRSLLQGKVFECFLLLHSWRPGSVFTSPTCSQMGVRAWSVGQWGEDGPDCFNSTTLLLISPQGPSNVKSPHSFYGEEGKQFIYQGSEGITVLGYVSWNILVCDIKNNKTAQSSLSLMCGVQLCWVWLLIYW